MFIHSSYNHKPVYNFICTYSNKVHGAYAGNIHIRWWYNCYLELLTWLPFQGLLIFEINISNFESLWYRLFGNDQTRSMPLHPSAKF